MCRYSMRPRAGFRSREEIRRGVQQGAEHLTRFAEALERIRRGDSAEAVAMMAEARSTSAILPLLDYLATAVSGFGEFVGASKAFVLAAMEWVRVRHRPIHLHSTRPPVTRDIHRMLSRHSAGVTCLQILRQDSAADGGLIKLLHGLQALPVCHKSMKHADLEGALACSRRPVATDVQQAAQAVLASAGLRGPMRTADPGSPAKAARPHTPMAPTPAPADVKIDLSDPAVLASCRPEEVRRVRRTLRPAVANNLSRRSRTSNVMFEATARTLALT